MSTPPNDSDHQPNPEDAAFGDGLSGVDPFDPPMDEMPLDEVEAAADSQGRIRSGKLAGRTLTSAIWVLAWPVLLQQTMQACVGLADKKFAGDLPGEMSVPALDAVGIGSYIGWFVGIAMAGLGIGGQVIIARAMGSGNKEEAHKALGQALTVAALWGVLVGIALWFAVTPLAAACGLGEEASAYCHQYVRTLAVSMPLCAIMMVGSMCLHGAGETTRPSLIAISVNICNIIASWILSGADFRIGQTVFENPFSFDLNVMGIAAGTSLSYAVGAMLTMLVVLRGVKDLQLEPHNMRPERVMIRRIVRIGIPNFCEGIAMWAVNIFVLMLIGKLVTDGHPEGLQGAHVIAVQWEAFSFMPGFAIGTAAGALAGQYLGAGNPAMAKKAVMVCTGIAILVMSAIGIVFLTQAEALTAFLSDDPVHRDAVPPLLHIAGGIQVFFALTMVVRQGLRGVGDTKWTFIITSASSYLVRLPACYVLGFVFEMGLTGIWLGLCGEMIVRAILFTTRFFHGGWKKLQV